MMHACRQRDGRDVRRCECLPDGIIKRRDFISPRAPSQNTLPLQRDERTPPNRGERDADVDVRGALRRYRTPKVRHLVEARESGRPCGVTCGGQTGQAGDFAIQGYSNFVSYIDEGGELLGTTD